MIGIVLVVDPLASILGTGTIMDFVVPGIVVGVLFTYIVYKILLSWDLL